MQRGRPPGEVGSVRSHGSGQFGLPGGLLWNAEGSFFKEWVSLSAPPLVEQNKHVGSHNGTLTCVSSEDLICLSDLSLRAQSSFGPPRSQSVCQLGGAGWPESLAAHC